VTDLQTEWTAALEAQLPDAFALRRELHAHPELSGQELWTAARVTDAIRAGAGESVGEQVIAETGRLLRIGPAEGPCVAIRAELDALPVREVTGAPFASGNGAMHACGHDVHLAAIAALARAARGLALPAALLVILQPREESQPSGGKDVVGSADLFRHDIRAAIGVHLQPQLPVGTAAADPGVVNAAVDEFEIRVTGVGGHSAYPHLARDPVPVLCRTVLALQEVLRGAVDPMHPAVVSVTELAAGRAANVIPGSASARGTLRTFRPADRDQLHDRLRETVVGMAASAGCDGQVRIIPGEPPLYNDPRLAAEAVPRLAEAGLAAGAPFRSCGSDDFAVYGEVIPSLMIFVGAGAGHDSPMLHDGRFLPADERVREVARAGLAGFLAGAESYAAAPVLRRS
jgi:amidohydrolase